MRARDTARGYGSAKASLRTRSRGQRGDGAAAPVGLEALEPRALLAVTLLTGSQTAGRADGDSVGALSVSDDGRYVVFASQASNLFLGQVARAGVLGRSDVFLHDRQTGQTSLVSRSAAGATVEGNGESLNPVISGDGRWIAFQSRASDLVAGARPPNGGGTPFGIYLFDRFEGQARLVTRSVLGGGGTGDGPVAADADAVEPAISRDGRYVSFLSAGVDDLVAGATDANGAAADVVLFDRTAGTLRLVSRAAAPVSRSGDAGSTRHAVSDGAVAFVSGASDLVAGQIDAAGTPDLFSFEIATGTLRLITRVGGTPATAAGFATGLPERSGGGFSLSDSGSRLAFATESSGLVPGVDDAAGGHADVYVADLDSGGLRLISRRDWMGPATGAAGDSFAPRLSGDGSAVVFLSRAPDLLAGLVKPDPSTWEIFHHRIDPRETRLVSHAPGAALATIGSAADHARISDDGRSVSFMAEASGLVRWLPRLTYTNYFVWDERTGLLEPALRNPEEAGRIRVESLDRSLLSGDGSTLVFAGDVQGTGGGGAVPVLNLFAFRPEPGPRLAVTSSAGAGAGEGLAVERSMQVGPATDFGQTLVRTGTVVREFTLWNDGVRALALGPSPVRISGTHASDYRLVAAPARTVEPGGSTVFRVEFDPTGPGARSATVVIDAPGEAGGRFEFDVGGAGATAGLAEFKKRGGGARFYSGATWNLGTHRGAGKRQGTVLLKNAGDAPLRVERMFLQANGGGRFQIVQKWSGSLNPGRSRDLTVALKGGRTGNWTGTLVLETDAGTVRVRLSGKVR